MDDLTSSIRDAFRDVNGRDMDIPIIKYDLRESAL